jgi:hypothetical protein
VWKQEKADARNKFLATLETNLSLEDEPLLEQALDDRGSNVRATASFLLRRLPGSALAQRMQERADSMLSYIDKKLVVKLPGKLDKTWERDGIADGTDKQKGKRAGWMTSVLAQVPPQHWEARFGLEPHQLLEAAIGTKWSWEIIESWSMAALLYNSIVWIAVLLDRWDSLKLDKQQKAAVQTLRVNLLSRLPQQELEQRILRMQESGGDWLSVVSFLPKPWSREFGEKCLQIMRDYILSLNENTHHDYDWTNFLRMMVMALPPSCFAAALQPWEVPDIDNWKVSQWKNEIFKFELEIDLRKRVLEEI